MNEIVGKSTIAVLTIMILLGAAMGATSASAQAADGEIAVSPTDVSLEQGESQTIAITYKRISDATPQGIEYTLAYDPDVVSVTDQEQGPYLGGRALVNNISTAGEIEYVEAIFDGGGVEKSSGTVATITIESANDFDNSATTELAFTTAKASEAETEFGITTTNGTVETAGSSETDDSTDDDSSDDQSSTDDDSSDDQSSTDDDSSDDQSSTDNDESQDTDSDTAERTNSSTTTDGNTSKTLINETEGNNSDETTDREQTTNDSSATDTQPETDTDESVPGFGIAIAVLSVLLTNYIVSKKPQ